MTDLSAQPTAPSFKGTVLTPGDPGYDDARRVFNGLVDRRPARIMRCTDAADVGSALLLARQEGLPVSVYGGGHGVTGSAVVDDGMCIDLRGLDRVVVDPVARTARVGGGATWGAVDAATQEFGLAVTAGRVSDHRRRRPDPRVGQRLARARLRVHLRQHARGRGRHRRRTHRDRVGEGEPRPVLGDPRRRRELRRRHRVPLPAAPGRADRARRHADVPRVDGPQPGPVLARLHDRRPGRGRVRRRLHHRPAAGLRAGAGARPARGRRGHLLRGRPRRRRR